MKEEYLCSIYYTFIYNSCKGDLLSLY